MQTNSVNKKHRPKPGISLLNFGELSILLLLWQSAAAQVILPSSNGVTIQLNSSYPGQSDFSVPTGNQIANNNGTAVQGDNSQNWYLINQGTIQAGNTSSSSGIKLSSAIAETSQVDNYGVISTASTNSNGPSGIQFTNGGIVNNFAGATISGADGVHTDGGSIIVNNYGQITGTSQSGIYSGVGARINNYQGASITGTYGIVSNGNSDVVIVNDGTIIASSMAIWVYGQGQDSLLNGPAGLIQGGSASSATIMFGSNDKASQMLNYGSIINPSNGNAIQGDVHNRVYINAGIIKGGSTSKATIVVNGDDNTIYNLNQLVSIQNALEINGDNNELVLGQHMTIAATNTIVTGPGSSITGSVVSTGNGNSIKLTDTGSTDNLFSGFSKLTMSGDNWTIRSDLALIGTDAGSVNVQSGQLLLTARLTTTGGTYIATGSTLLLDSTSVLSSAGSINNFGTLSGYGQVIGTVINNGIVSAGNATTGFADRSPGWLTISGTLTNNGRIDLRGTTPGNSLHVSGNYSGQGSLYLNTALGNDHSPTDTMLIDSGYIDGNTAIYITNAGGTGEQTTNGIRIIELDHGATSTSTAFHLSGRATAGLYDYNLYQNPTDQQWYLYSSQTPPSPSPSQPNYRPELGAYLANIYAAATLFQHSLFDRTGGTPPADDTNVWIRVAGYKRKNHTFSNRADINADTALVQAGNDIYRTSLYKGNDELRIGLMTGYGYVKSDTSISGNTNHAKGMVDSVVAGAYATWFADKELRHGTYIDIWTLYGWQRNKVKGDGLPEQIYHSNTVDVSLESGYIWKPVPEREVFVVPQVQTIWSDYIKGSHFEKDTRLSITNENSGGWALRTGLRVYGNMSLTNGKTLQPFAELNWLYNGANFQASFNERRIDVDASRQQAELKLGLNGQITPALAVWGQLTGQIGQHDYHAFGGTAGIVYSF